MSRDAFEFMRHNIHFSDNSNINKNGVHVYNPLFKVIHPLEIIMKGVRSVGTVGKHVTIDNSMVKYMGRDVIYVQNMPANPITHGIKVFSICCSLSERLLGFKIYVGQEDDSDNTSLVICDYLVK